ncbi:MAG: penicillin-binding protein 1C, partial [Bacteroidia bacterium]
KEYSFPKFHSKLKSLGLKTLNKPPGHYGLSIILGGAEGTLWDLCGMYASMGRSLIHFQIHSLEYKSNNYRSLSFTKTSDSKNSNSLKKTSELSASAIWFTLKAMEEVHRPENQIGWQNFSSSKKVAWKTGTSFGYRDAWAIGIDGKYVVGVWIGNANGVGRNGLVGVKKAAPIMFDIFNILPNSNWFTPPFDDFKQLVVCKESGHAATDVCISYDTVFVPNIDIQISPCPYHKMVHLDNEMKFRVNSNCESIGQMKSVPWFVLPPVQEYYYSKKNNWYKKLPVYRSDCNNSNQSEKAFSFIYPEDFSKVKIPTELNGEKGELIVRIAHREPESSIYWYIDNAFVEKTTHYHELGIYLKPGKHSITAMDQKGERITQSLIILE